MTDRLCKCCGQTLPVDIGIEVSLARGLKTIVEVVRKAGQHGISTDRLFNRIYGHDRDGGPLTGVKVLHVRISRINKTLRPQGWEIVGEHTGNSKIYGSYRLQPVQPRKDGRSTRWHSATTNTPA